MVEKRVRLEQVNIVKDRDGEYRYGRGSVVDGEHVGGQFAPLPQQAQQQEQVQRSSFSPYSGRFDPEYQARLNLLRQRIEEKKKKERTASLAKWGGLAALGGLVYWKRGAILPFLTKNVNKVGEVLQKGKDKVKEVEKVAEKTKEAVEEIAEVVSKGKAKAGEVVEEVSKAKEKISPFLSNVKAGAKRIKEGIKERIRVATKTKTEAKTLPESKVETKTESAAKTEPVKEERVRGKSDYENLADNFNKLARLSQPKQETGELLKSQVNEINKLKIKIANNPNMKKEEIDTINKRVNELYETIKQKEKTLKDELEKQKEIAKANKEELNKTIEEAQKKIDAGEINVEILPAVTAEKRMIDLNALGNKRVEAIADHKDPVQRVLEAKGKIERKNWKADKFEGILRERKVDKDGKLTDEIKEVPIFLFRNKHHKVVNKEFVNVNTKVEAAKKEKGQPFWDEVIPVKVKKGLNKEGDTMVYGDTIWIYKKDYDKKKHLALSEGRIRVFALEERLISRKPRIRV